jgi:carbon monoxide dehydrogenase subunit G|tara:strand:+ start:12214 stop:12795 length:582 start_codon:yes stop_codon:yes gene_type:complete
MNGEYRIEASREKVWAALNDTQILKESIPGCEQINRLSETEMTATVVAKVGPVKAKFTGQVTLSDLNPPNSYRISGEGKGGAAGFAKGGANISLQSDGNATVLSYSVDATVGGKLAQLGARLIDGTAKKLAGEFFANFADIVSDSFSSDIKNSESDNLKTTNKSELSGPVIGIGTWIGGLIVIAAVVLAIITS